MTNGMPYFRPIEFPAEPPDNGDGQKTKRCKFEIFPRVGFQWVFKLLLAGNEPQDIGPSGKATTFAACRARKGKMTARATVIWTLGCFSSDH